MTRDEAIDHIFGLAASVENEFACTAGDSRRIYAETDKALRTLGVTEAELRKQS